jgi:deoxyadenosine/deoxycytidine kinase
MCIYTNRRMDWAWYIDGTSIIEKFYKDKQRYTFSFQVYIWKIINNKNIILFFKSNSKNNNMWTFFICE